MSVCQRCGHVLGVGRFCTNCGHPIDAPPPVGDPAAWGTDTAERPAVPAAPAPARYPLYADEPAVVATGSHRAVAPRRPLWPLWVAAAVALVLVAVVGAVLLFGGGGEAPTAADPATSSPAEPSPSREPTSETASPSPTEPATPSPTATTPPAEPTEVAPRASVEVPATAPPNEDTEGNLVRYEGRNMLDGVPETTWRMPGDGSGETIVITLGARTTVSSLGLVNGYAKTAGDFDWYEGNRRVLAVVWELDDGTTFSQDLTETRDLQTIDVPEVPTTTVRLTLVEVSDPGRGPSRRDYTAISEVSVVGVPEA